MNPMVCGVAAFAAVERDRSVWGGGCCARETASLCKSLVFANKLSPKGDGGPGSGLDGCLVLLGL